MYKRQKEYRRLNQFVMTLNHPIDLTESEYRKYKSLDEFRKAAFLKEIDKKHGAIDLTQGEQRLLQAHEQSRDIMEEKIYRQTSNEYEEEQKEPRAGLFAAEERLLDAERLKETKIEPVSYTHLGGNRRVYERKVLLCRKNILSILR